MRLIDQIVEDATGDGVALSVILRKCMVVASKLGNARLKKWATSELDGYGADEQLPNYRSIRVPAYGTLVGVAYQLNDHPIPASVLQPEHRHFATTYSLRAGVATYEALVKQDKA